MFQLIANIFQQHKTTADDLPEALVDMATERALLGTDPRIRILPQYKKQLRQPVIHAIRHVIALVDQLQPAIAAKPASLATDPALSALFYSAERMADILSTQACLKDYRAAHPGADCYALLMAEYSQKQVFGHALIDDKPVSDVAQITVSFSAQRLVGPAADETTVRRLLKHRSFDHLLTLALAQIAEQQDERDQLALQRSLLRSKAEIIQRHGGFVANSAPENLVELQQRLQLIEEKLIALGPVHEVFEKNLAIVCEILANAEKYFWLEELDWRLDRYYVLHDDQDAVVPALRFQQVRDAQGHSAIVRLLAINA